VIANLNWQLGYLIDHFGRLELLEIDVAWSTGSATVSRSARSSSATPRLAANR
jgi:hypothetical protein